MKHIPAIELKHLTKRFGKIVANEDISLSIADGDIFGVIGMSIREGEILAILGENGSGKTTLMNMISGIYYPDEGEILVHGEPVSIRSPRDAYPLGIGMIHQHFKLVDVLTAAENIVLGLPGRQRLDMAAVATKINQLTHRYGFELDPFKKVYEMSVSEKQTVEIVKMLYRGAKILILDEPTAVLTPQETHRLFDVLRNMRADGNAIVIITHKLNEVLELSDRVAVLRKGRYIGSVDTASASIASLTEMMVGKRVELNIVRSEPKQLKRRLAVKDVSCVNPEGVITLNHVSFTLDGGEILGIAGVAGSGQRELLETIAGLTKAESGEIDYFPPNHEPQELTKLSAVEINRLGVRLSFVPEDRLGMGLVGPMDMVDNMMIRSYKRGGHFWVDRKAPRSLAEKIIRDLEVVTPGVGTPVGKLSGGNVQKVLVGREIASNPSVLMVAYPVRGLDIHSSHTIYRLLDEQKRNGVAVLCVGEDLDVLLALCDRILVMCGGRVTGIVDARTATKEQIGMLMMRTEGSGKP